MGFHFNPLKTVTRALNIPDRNRHAIDVGLQIGFFPYGVTKAAVDLGQGLFKSVSKSRQPAAAYTQQLGYQPGYNVTYGAPSYSGTVGGGSLPYQFQNPETFNPYGVSPWGFSTQSPTYSPMPSVGYSAPPADRTWEDLALAAIPLLL